MMQYSYLYNFILVYAIVCRSADPPLSMLGTIVNLEHVFARYCNHSLCVPVSLFYILFNVCCCVLCVQMQSPTLDSVCDISCRLGVQQRMQLVCEQETQIQITFDTYTVSEHNSSR